MLTQRQYELLFLIHQQIQRTGTAPSYEEMREQLSLNSKSGVHRLVSALEERGFIRRLPHRARALEIVKLPQRSIPAQGMSEQEVTGKFHSVPLMGRIAAGTPVEALQDMESYIEVPESLLRDGEHYALEVRGDSMVGAGIMEHDTVVIQKTDTAISGEIVVALVDNREVTLKRLRTRGGSIALEPANPAYETHIFSHGQVQIQGRLIALIRRY